MDECEHVLMCGVLYGMQMTFRVEAVEQWWKLIW